MPNGPPGTEAQLRARANPPPRSYDKNHDRWNLEHLGITSSYSVTSTTSNTIDCCCPQTRMLAYRVRAAVIHSSVPCSQAPMMRGDAKK
ncbi:MAG: hypothetical protein IT435_18365 [Phycisphaerales bacterium]|nr:hypothetical protein [Phycisphaerales bacterium]